MAIIGCIDLRGLLVVVLDPVSRAAATVITENYRGLPMSTSTATTL